MDYSGNNGDLPLHTEGVFVQAARQVRVHHHHSGNIQGTFREHSGNIQGTFR
jgi:hypothetical protein